MADFQVPIDTNITFMDGPQAGKVTEQWFDWLRHVSQEASNNGPSTTIINSPYVTVTDLGALADGVECTGSISASSLTLSITGASVSAADIGKSIVIVGAGPGGENLYTTIAATPAGTLITLAAAASTAVSSALVIFGTDNHSILQTIFDGNPSAAIFFPEGKYVCNGTIVLSSKTPLRHFVGQVLGVGGQGSEIFFFNAGSVSDDDSDMQHGFGAYNRVANPAILASEVSGVQNIVFQGFGICMPDYGAGFFFGNCAACQLSDIRFRSYQDYPSTCLPRHGVVIDCGINMAVDHCGFDGSTLVSFVGIIKSLDTATGHVVYTNPPGSGYFNDSHAVTYCGFNGSTSFVILDMGTGSFTNRTVENNYAGGGAKIWFYVGSNGVSTRFMENWTETCTYGIGIVSALTAGDIPGTTIPHSYIQGAPGLPEHVIIDNNQFANISIVYYSEANDISRSILTRNRLNGSTIPGVKWIVSTSSAPNIEFSDSNEVIYSGSIYGALSPVVNPSVAMVNDATYQATVFPSGRVSPSWQRYLLEITSGGNWFLNGRDLGYGPVALPLQFIYIIDPQPEGSVISGITMSTVTAFSATGLTQMAVTVGDGVGGGADSTWYTITPYDLIPAASGTNHAEFTVCRGPQDSGDGHTYLSVTANQNLNAHPITGAVEIFILWGLDYAA